MEITTPPIVNKPLTLCEQMELLCSLKNSGGLTATQFRSLAETILSSVADSGEAEMLYQLANTILNKF